MPSSSRPAAGEVVRTSLVVSAAVGIILGVIALFWPGATLLSIAVFFGVAVLVAGALRVLTVVIDKDLTTAWRIGYAVLGVVLVGAGILIITRPVSSLIFIALVIGFSWVASGVRDIVFALRADGRTRILAVVSGAVSIIGGIVMFLLPGLALDTFAVVGGLLLIVVSVATLLTMPSRAARR